MEKYIKPVAEVIKFDKDAVVGTSFPGLPGHGQTGSQPADPSKAGTCQGN